MRWGDWRRSSGDSHMAAYTLGAGEEVELERRAELTRRQVRRHEPRATCTDKRRQHHGKGRGADWTSSSRDG